MMSWLEWSYKSKSLVRKVFRPLWTSPFISCCCNFLLLAWHSSISPLSLSHSLWSSVILLSRAHIILYCVSCTKSGGCAMFAFLDSFFPLHVLQTGIFALMYSVICNCCSMGFIFAPCCHNSQLSFVLIYGSQYSHTYVLPILPITRGCAIKLFILPSDVDNGISTSYACNTIVLISRWVHQKIRYMTLHVGWLWMQF